MALIVVGIDIYFGFKLWKTAKSISMDGGIGILKISLLSAFGILIDSIAFLIYYIINVPTTYFAIVLVFTEIVPIVAMLMIIGFRVRNRGKHSTSSNSDGICSSAINSGRSIFN
jgi:ABC-type transport system involved in Fe-S cluster assembly fused permease/ATPase subunit